MYRLMRQVTENDIFLVHFPIHSDGSSVAGRYLSIPARLKRTREEINEKKSLSFTTLKCPIYIHYMRVQKCIFTNQFRLSSECDDD